MVATNKTHLKNIIRVNNPQGNRIFFTRLDKNERTIPFPLEHWDAMLKSLNPEMLTVYPENCHFQSKLAKYLGDFTEKHLFLTAGSDLAIKACFESFVAPGDEVVFVAPTFAMVGVYCDLFEAKKRAVECGEDLRVSPKEVCEKINNKTKLVYVANPNSPTGREMSLDEVKQILDKALLNDTLVLVDEAYFGFTSTSTIELTKRYENLAVCRTFSKAAGLAGLRLGYIVAQPRLIELLSKWRPMYEVNNLALHFAEYLIDHPEIIEAYQNTVKISKEKIYRWCELHKIKYFHSDANFINLVVGAKNLSPIVSACEKLKILVKPAGDHKYLKDCIRVSLGTFEQAEPVLDIILKMTGIQESHLI